MSGKLSVEKLDKFFQLYEQYESKGLRDEELLLIFKDHPNSTYMVKKYHSKREIFRTFLVTCDDRGTGMLFPELAASLYRDEQDAPLGLPRTYIYFLNWLKRDDDSACWSGRSNAEKEALLALFRATGNSYE